MMFARLFIGCALVLSGFVASAQDSLNMRLVYHWEDTLLPSSNDWDNAYNEVWGFVMNGNEYAVIGTTMGTHIFDITNPANGFQAAYIPGAAQGPIIIHRDYHDYADYLYIVADEGPSTLQIVDISYLPDSVQMVYDARDLLERSHNIFIDSATARLYACGVRDFPNGANDLEIYSLANPELPVLEADYNGFAYYHDIYVQNDTAFGNNGPAGLSVIDFAAPTSPVLLGSLTTYPDQGYNHSGWATPDLNYYWLADEDHGNRIKCLDISDLTDIQVVSVFGSGVDTMSVPHNLILKDSLLFASYYHDGLYIFNVADPANPTIHGYYDTQWQPGHDSFRGNWGVYPFLPSGRIIASDMQNGLFVFEVDGLNVGTQEFQKPSTELFRIGPNPIRDEIRILSLAGEGTFMAEIRDMSGRLIHQSTFQSTAGQSSFLRLPSHSAAGTYFISVQKDGYLQTERLIKTQ